MSQAAYLLSLIRERRRTGPKEPSYRSLHRVADRAIASVRGIFRSAVAQTKKETITAKLEMAIAHHAREAALSCIPWDEIGAKILENRLTEKFLQIIIAAGTAAQRHQPEGLQLRLGARNDDQAELLEPSDLGAIFDASNPHAIKVATEKAAAMVTAINEETREALRLAVASAIEEGRPPRVAARDIRDMIGLNSRQQEAINTLRDGGATELEVARAIREAVNYRADMIARTETLRASNLGQQALWDVAEDSGLIDATAQREWVATPDERECPQCGALDGKLFPLDGVIHTEFGDYTEPPIHPHCRCVMVLNIQ